MGSLKLLVQRVLDNEIDDAGHVSFFDSEGDLQRLGRLQLDSNVVKVIVSVKDGLGSREELPDKAGQDALLDGELVFHRFQAGVDSIVRDEYLHLLVLVCILRLGKSWGIHLKWSD